LSPPPPHREAGAIRASEDRSLTVRVIAETRLRSVTAGSALLRVGGSLLAIGDDAFRISRIALPTFAVTPLVLAGDGAPLAKVSKPDFEAAVLAADGVVHLLGSGSTENRCTFARVDLGAARAAFTQRPDVYRCVQEALALTVRANIEGAVASGARLRLLHRGAAGAPSAIVDVPLAVLDGAASVALGAQAFELGDLDGVGLGFTDAAAVADGRIVFVAAAEDAADAIVDGPVTGSVIGLIEQAGGRASARWARVAASDGGPWRYKVEGIALDDDVAGGWILTDADDPASATVLARIELRGFARAGG
jgi:hypothetical protein